MEMYFKSIWSGHGFWVGRKSLERSFSALHSPASCKERTNRLTPAGHPGLNVTTLLFQESFAPWFSTLDCPIWAQNDTLRTPLKSYYIRSVGEVTLKTPPCGFWCEAGLGTLCSSTPMLPKCGSPGSPWELVREAIPRVLPRPTELQNLGVGGA